jgi:hypothetical protein
MTIETLSQVEAFRRGLQEAAKVAEAKAAWCLSQRAGHAEGSDGWNRWTSLYAQAASTADSIHALAARAARLG